MARLLWPHPDLPKLASTARNFSRETLAESYRVGLEGASPALIDLFARMTLLKRSLESSILRGDRNDSGASLADWQRPALALLNDLLAQPSRHAPPLHERHDHDFTMPTGW